jgi:hypothetical protein
MVKQYYTCHFVVSFQYCSLLATCSIPNEFWDLCLYSDQLQNRYMIQNSSIHLCLQSKVLDHMLIWRAVRVIVNVSSGGRAFGLYDVHIGAMRCASLGYLDMQRRRIMPFPYLICLFCTYFCANFHWAPRIYLFLLTRLYTTGNLSNMSYLKYTNEVPPFYRSSRDLSQ